MAAVDTFMISEAAAASLVESMLTKPVCMQATMGYVQSHPWLRDDESVVGFGESALKRRGSESTTDDSNDSKRRCN